MVTPHLSEWDGSVVLIADPYPDKNFSGDYDRRIDQPGSKTVDEIYTAIQSKSNRTYFIKEIKELIELTDRYPGTLVFPYWFGQISRSRHGLVPAICEARKIKFVGADAYAKIVCNDKELSKSICRLSGLKVPKSFLLNSTKDFDLIRNINYPVITKPNFEGSSLGITSRNKCYNLKDTKDIARELFLALDQQVIVEEFIYGREFSACLIEGPDGLDIKVGFWSVNNDDNYLNDRVFDYKIKVDKNIDMEFIDMTNEISKSDILKMKNCFYRLGKVEFIRIDGRITSTGPVIIELTPDAFLGKGSEFAAIYRSTYGEYQDFIERLILNSIEWYKTHGPIG